MRYFETTIEHLCYTVTISDCKDEILLLDTDVISHLTTGAFIRVLWLNVELDSSYTLHLRACTKASGFTFESTFPGASRFVKRMWLLGCVLESIG